MQRPTRIATVVIIGAWLGACSEPASRTAKNPASDRLESTRDVRLAESPSGGAAVASNLETGRPVSSIAAPTVRQARGPLRALTEAAAPVVPPMVLPATEAVAGLPLDAVPMPESHTIYLAPVGEMDQPSPVNISAGPSAGGEPHIGHDYGGSRGPSIIIRGGMGGVDDKCDLRPRGFGGIAINRAAPSLGGSSGRGGFPRGIR